MNTQKRISTTLVTLLSLLLAPSLSFATDGTWTEATKGGYWNTSRNWANNSIASGAGATATFSTETSGLKKVFLDANVIVGNLELEAGKAAGNGWTIESPGGYGLTLASGTTFKSPAINVSGGSSLHVISAPLRGTEGLTKNGNGKLILTGNNVYTGYTTVTDGNLTVLSANALGAAGQGNGTIIDMSTGKYPQLHVGRDITLTEEIALRVRYYSPKSGATVGANMLYADVGDETVGGLVLDRASSSSADNINLFGVQVAKGTLTITGPVRGVVTGVQASGGFADPNVLRFRLNTVDSKVYVTGPITDGTIGIGGVSVQTNDDSAGTVRLMGDSTYSGSTVHKKGVLLINNTSGSGTGTGAVVVASGATLGGTGTIAPTGANGITLASGAIFAPGDINDGPAVLAPGRPLTIDLRGTTGQVVFDENTSIIFDLGKKLGVNDRLSVTGVGGGENRVFFKNTVVNFTHTGPVAKGLYTLVSFDTDDGYAAQLSIGSGLEGYHASLQYTSKSIQLLVEGGASGN